MTYDDLCNAVKNKALPAECSDTILCLWQAMVEGWETAHIIVESLPEPTASWIHAMLHREEGDRGNAMYWYSRADKAMPNDSAALGTV